MELSMMQMYWLLMLDNIGTTLTISAIIIAVCMVIACICGVFYLEEIIYWKDVPWKPIKKYSILSVSVFLVVVLFNTFLPSTKQMAAVIVVPKIVNNEQVQQIPDKILNLGLEWLEDLNPNKEEKKE